MIIFRENRTGNSEILMTWQHKTEDEDKWKKRQKTKNEKQHEAPQKTWVNPGSRKA